MIPKDILDKLDDVIARRTMKLTNNRDMYMGENLLLTAYCGHPEFDPWQIAEVLNTSIGTKAYTGRGVIQTLNKMNLKAGDRKRLIETALHMGEVGFHCFNGDKHAFKQFREYVVTPNKHPEQMRCILMALFGNHPQLQELAHAQDILYLGRAYAKYCLLDLIDGAEDLYHPWDRDIPSAEDFEQQFARKEAQLRRTNEMLEELQKEFEIRIQESKTQERANFFSTLNSEKYGFILDGLFATKTGLEELKKRHYALPLEINGLTILIRKLIQFVKDSGINPVLRIGEIMTVTSQDIENYHYLGSPFEDDRVVKKVQVIAPGWYLKDRDIQVSRPTIKEIKEEEVHESR
ncbi:MAG: hypothetical protein LBD93_09630 [Treponema sp.]|jgi:hypothetical protein|nr:hypothetical protein [Treponema sp.]